MSNSKLPDREWIEQLFKTIDAQDAQGFANFFAEDGAFIFGSIPPAKGRQAVSEFVRYFFSTLKSLSHKLIDFHEANDLLYIRFDVTYEVHDGRTVTIPGLETVEMQRDLVSRYVIYLDPSPLQALQEEA